MINATRRVASRSTTRRARALERRGRGRDERLDERRRTRARERAPRATACDDGRRGVSSSGQPGGGSVSRDPRKYQRATRDGGRGSRRRENAGKRGERCASLTTCARVGDGGCVTRVPGRREARRGERRAELVTRPARRDDVHRQCYASHRSREKNRVKGRWWCRRCGRGGMREPRWVME